MCDSINQKLISSDSDGLLNITEEQQIMLARSILTSLGQLKFLNTGLLDNLCMMLSSKIVDNTNNDKSILKSKDFASFLMTTSTLNYCPKNSDALYEVCEAKINTLIRFIRVKHFRIILKILFLMSLYL